jgi:hemerythrin superfamily protein
MKNSQEDALSLLTDDHAEVRALFEKFEGLSDRSKVSKKRVADNICEALTVHAQIEEELFYPAVRQAIKDKDMVDEAIVEHASAKELVAQIREMDAGEDLYDAKLKVLSEQVEHHVREEEDEMFPKVRESRLDLEALGNELRARKEQLKGAGA